MRLIFLNHVNWKQVYGGGGEEKPLEKLDCK